MSPPLLSHPSNKPATPTLSPKIKYAPGAYWRIYGKPKFVSILILYDLEYNPGVLFIFGGQKWGFYSRGGLIEGGFNKFRPEGAKFFTFFSQKYAFLCCPLMKYPLYCLLNMSIFIVVKLKLSYFKINQLFNKQKQ